MANIIAQTRSKVRTFMKDAYGKQYNSIVQEVDGSFIVRRGSAAVHVSIKPLHKTDCIVQALSYVVQGAKIGPKLLGHLMRLNATNLLGAYGLLFDDTITFSHTIMGANLDQNELRTTIATVAFVADETDDEIMKMAGGQRAVDAMSDINGLAEMPLIPGKKLHGTKPSNKPLVPKRSQPKQPTAKKPSRKK